MVFLTNSSRAKRRSVDFQLALSCLICLFWIPQLGNSFSVDGVICPGFTARLSSNRSERQFDSLPDQTKARRDSIHQWRTKSSLFSTTPISHTGSGLNRGNDILRGGKTLSSKQILFPEVHLSGLNHPTSFLEEDRIPLFAAIQFLIQSLEKIISASSKHLTSEELTNEETTLLAHLDDTTILRIEESISAVHSVDPLCWLHGQKSSIRNLRRKLSSSGDTLPVIYFGDAEGQVEASIIGKVSPSYSDSWDPFVGKRIWDNESDIGNDGQAQQQQQHSMFKESDLPPRARVYGGSRFDWKFYQDKIKKQQYMQQQDADDWDGFGGDRGGFWILPAVELRRESVHLPTEPGNNCTNDNTGNGCTRRLTFAIHLHNLEPSCSLDHNSYRVGWHDAAKRTLSILLELSDQLSPPIPCTTLPPVLTRSESTGKDTESGGGDPGNAFERGVTEALRQITGSDVDTALRKVVLARKVDLSLGSSVSGLDVLMKLKFGGHIGHIFYLNPGDDEAANSSQFNNGLICSREFLGCTPERLFRVKGQDGARTVTSEALAGTRIRGLTPSADAELLRELLSSEKDMLENEITGKFISDALQELEDNGWLEKCDNNNLITKYEFNGIANDKVYNNENNHQRRFFVRRLRHLQHICQTFEGSLSEKAKVIDVSRSLLASLHPTPAVCGDSADAAIEFIRQFETLASYDRGYYAGPFGYLGRDSADIVVAIRSGLVTNYQRKANFNPLSVHQNELIPGDNPDSKISVFAGAGVVEGSTVQGEWTEISHKLGVISSLFPSSPLTLQSYSSPNVAWSSAFIEELIRCGVTTFYVCPGSRNTPLTTAIFKAMRSNIGIVRAISVHDERGAGFRALGYARQNGRPAAVVTSSGTAVANLYPSVVEASSDGVPLLLLTADRPYESRDTGSNQSIDQVKIFSSSYVRWFRDIPSPSDDVPVSLALSDANHAVSLTKELMGPVHLNIQFRENLAPDDGPIRNDNRVGSITNFHNARFTDIPGFAQWSQSGGQWLVAYHSRKTLYSSVMEVADLIFKSRRGIIVAGNLRNSDIAGGADDLSSTIAHFAKTIGFPILAGVQSGALRREAPTIPYAEHLLKHPLVSKGMQPDLILQLGSPLVSTEISGMITKSMKLNTSMKHVLVQQLHPYERADPDQTVTHRVSTNIGMFLKDLMSHLDSIQSPSHAFGSELAPLLHLGRELRKEMPTILAQNDASNSNVNGDGEHADSGEGSLTEPQLMLALAEVLAESSSRNQPMSLFLSNSMPVRDGEFFLYPSKASVKDKQFPVSISVNRGASGIDGIVSTAIGCADSFNPTTLVCGDVTTLHDLNAFYGLTPDYSASSNKLQPNVSNLNRIPLTTVIVNNGGGAIFSFLPISKHGQDVGFDEYWGTPTDNFSFSQGAAAFGLPYKYASSFQSFKDAYRASIMAGTPTIIEAKVTSRSTNVDVHQKITRKAVNVVEKLLNAAASTTNQMKLPIKQYNSELTQSSTTELAGKSKTLLLIHGWMGDKSDWDVVASSLSADLSDEWNIVAIDLPGHGDAPVLMSSPGQIVRASLQLDPSGSFESESPLTLDEMALSVCRSLIKDYQLSSIDAIVGYSLGGRIALAMKRLCSSKGNFQGGMPSVKREVSPTANLITDQTRLILLGSDPGKLPSNLPSDNDKQRVAKDVSLSKSLSLSSFRSFLSPDVHDTQYLIRFLTKWYNAPLWGDLGHRDSDKYQEMINRRLRSFAKRRHDLAAVLVGCSPPLTTQNDWQSVVPSKTTFVAGALDKKYSSIGRRWQEARGISKYVQVSNAGHALLVEQPLKIANIVISVIKDETFVDEHDIPAESPVAAAAGLMTGQSAIVEKHDRSNSLLNKIIAMEYESFGVTLVSADGSDKGILGVGWGESARSSNELKRKEGFIISLASNDGLAVGIGEVSPLKGLHSESLVDTERQLGMIKSYLSTGTSEHSFYAEDVLSFDGSLTKFVDHIMVSAGIKQPSIAPSVRSGVEMAVLSVASQIVGSPLPQALARHHLGGIRSASFGLLPVNGLVTRGSTSQSVGDIAFPSIKVKVGDKDPLVDAQTLVNMRDASTAQKVKLRADANRAWASESAQAFANELRHLDTSTLSAIEFIEEPLEKQYTDGQWSLKAQVKALEDFTRSSKLLYALDESLVDLAESYEYDFERVAGDLRASFGQNVFESGCAAFVLKPAMLGFELSMQIAKLAQEELRIPVVFSSSFDSGIGLAYTSILAAVADKSPATAGLAKYAHGLGTFAMLSGDTLSPSFKSYVNKDGLLNVASLSRALYGLSLDEISDRLPVYDVSSVSTPTIATSESESYAASTTSSTGRDITVAVSMPLPFSDGIASSRFTDLPQMSRWSPWLNSVTYLDATGLTEWNLNIKGVKFSWKAQSEVLHNPKGIRWKSISGLRNSGVVEFEPVSADSCVMKLKMSIIMPYILVSLFQGMPSVVHDFLQNKLLKWSLEMFRDVVKADLALERGDNELGDALFGAVEGRANALEEALK